MFTEQIDKWIELALDADISEKDFWEMTFGEVGRVLESRKRVNQQRAYMDYKLADLIGYSVARVHNKANQMPSIYDSYPNLFNEEEDELALEERRMERSAINFLEFARAFNKKFEGVLEE